RRKTKGESGLSKTALGPRDVVLKSHAKRRQDVGAAAAAGHGAVAMLDHGHAGAGGEECRSSTDVKRAGLITADAASVEHVRAAGLKADHVFTENGRSGGQFPGRFTLH